jgi:hypothetical protein
MSEPIITAQQLVRALANSKQGWSTDGSGWINGEDGTAVFLPGLLALDTQADDEQPDGRCTNCGCDLRGGRCPEGCEGNGPLSGKHYRTLFQDMEEDDAYGEVLHPIGSTFTVGKLLSGYGEPHYAILWEQAVVAATGEVVPPKACEGMWTCWTPEEIAKQAEEILEANLIPGAGAIGFAKARYPRKQADEVVDTVAEAVRRAHADFESARGQIIPVLWVMGYDDHDNSVERGADPGNPFKVRADATNQSSIEHFNDEYLDPYWDITIIEPRPELDGIRSCWMWGKSYRVRERMTQYQLAELETEPLEPAPGVVSSYCLTLTPAQRDALGRAADWAYVDISDGVPYLDEEYEASDLSAQAKEFLILGEVMETHLGFRGEISRWTELAARYDAAAKKETSNAT